MQEEYGHFVVMSDDDEKSLAEMSDVQIDILSAILTHSIRRTEIRLMEEYENRIP